MQDQTTGGANLQQPRADLQQQSTPNLQQSGTPTSTANTSAVLSEAAPTGELKVSTATNSSSTISPAVTLQTNGHGATLLLLVIPVLLVIAIFWPRKNQPAAPIEAESIPEPVAVPTPKKSPKSKKKTTKKKKESRR